MRVLFVPSCNGGLAHQIPLLALNRKLDASFETAFLLPRKMHQTLSIAGINILDIDHTGFRTEMFAYGQFSPDVVVDDCSITTGFATTLKRVPRVTIQRTGSLPGWTPRNKNHQHSSSFEKIKLPDTSVIGIPQPQTLADLFQAKIKIIPGIRSIEVLPEAIRDDPSFVFSGPLLMDDYLLGQLGGQTTPAPSDGTLQNFEPLREFFETQRGRKTVYATFGTVAEATGEVFECLRYLLESGVAVVTSIRMELQDEGQKSRFFYARYLPMHFVCANIDLMIHHCGSGTYHYPILHGVPSITIGTKCYDRDDVAARLDELGTSIHLGAPDESDNFIEDFKNAVRRYFEVPGTFLSDAQRRLAELNCEIERTATDFDFIKTLARTLD